MLGVFLYLPYVALILDFKSAMTETKNKMLYFSKKRNQDKAVGAYSTRMHLLLGEKIIRHSSSSYADEIFRRWSKMCKCAEL